MTYHSHLLHFPDQHPFDRPDCRWTGFVGAFAAELMRGRSDLFWFSYYGSFARFRLYTDSYDTIRPEIDALASSLGLGLDDSESGLTLVADLGHDRFLAPDSESNSEKRAELVLRYLHSIAMLMIDNVQKDSEGYYRLEQSQSQQNPLKNNFESLAHLLANMTQFQFPVAVRLQSPWMADPVTAGFPIHL